MSYSDRYLAYIASPRWAARKKKFAAGHPKQCASCASKKRVQLHHKSYERLEAELDQDLAWLCWRCHTRLHKLVSLGLATIADIEALKTIDKTIGKPAKVRSERQRKLRNQRARERTKAAKRKQFDS